MTEMKQKEYPSGIGKEIIEERKKLALPAFEVKNSVTWVNPAFKGSMPFDLHLGRSTNLGVFFMPNEGLLYEHEHREARKKITLLPEIDTTRSGQWGSVIFRDKDGRLYRDVDAKGVGLVEFYSNANPMAREIRQDQEKTNYQEKTSLGIIDYNFAERDRRMSEKFIKAGIRTQAVLGITMLDEIIDKDGKRISIEEARKRNLIASDTQPVIEFRAFGTRDRISSLQLGKTERKKAAFEDAKTLVAQELGRDPKDFSADEYLSWFAKTLGEQIAKIRKLKMHHKYLHTQNITLDCRIVDLDSVDFVKEKLADVGPEYNEESFYENDFDAGSNSLGELFKELRNTMEVVPKERWWEDYGNLYRTAYEEELQRGEKK